MYKQADMAAAVAVTRSRQRWLPRRCRVGRIAPSEVFRRFVVFAGALLCLLAAGCGSWNTMGNQSGAYVFHTMIRADLPITVMERGTLESRLLTEIKCEVESLGFEQTGMSGTQIIEIVPNGSSVKKGDLIVELDSTALRERMDAQILAFAAAKASQIQANVKYENQKTQNQTALKESQVKLKLAELEVKMYDDGEDGSYQISLQEVDLKVQEAKSQISDAQTALAMRVRELGGVNRLFQLGYRGRGDLEEAEYSHMQAEDTLLRALNTLVNAKSNSKKLRNYDYPMQKLKLESTVETARGALLQLERDNWSLMAQAEAAKVAADRSLTKEEEKLERYQTQLTKCKILAPHDGMVAYSTAQGTFIGEGEFINQRQTILTLPDLTSMMVKTQIHESMSSEIQSGMSATITVEGFRNRTYWGKVESVAVLPSSSGFFGSQIKTYETIIRIDDKVIGMKPGITVVVRIHVDKLENVLSVPVQAVVQVGNENWCYVKTAGALKRKTVKLGQTNEKFVEIQEGLSVGEQVVLNAMDVVDQEQDQLVSD